MMDKGIGTNSILVSMSNTHSRGCTEMWQHKEVHIEHTKQWPEASKIIKHT